jgi:hypothetical protein
VCSGTFTSSDTLYHVLPIVRGPSVTTFKPAPPGSSLTWTCSASSCARSSVPACATIFATTLQSLVSTPWILIEPSRVSAAKEEPAARGADSSTSFSYLAPFQSPLWMMMHEVQANSIEASEAAHAILVYSPLVISSPFHCIQIIRSESASISVRPEPAHVNADPDRGPKTQSLSGLSCLPLRISRRIHGLIPQNPPFPGREEVRNQDLDI